MLFALPRPGRSGSLKRTGFTLIELLVVVAIIAVLAAIAVPNLMEAQVRSKVSRVKADLRTITGALETYAADHGGYPYPVRYYKESLSTVHELSTPVAYLATTLLLDVFPPTEEDLNPPPPPGYGYAPTYMYDNYAGAFGEEWYRVFGVSTFTGFGVVSVGPNRIYEGVTGFPFYVDTDPKREASYVRLLYDPTNGTVSRGDIIRWSGKPQKYASG